MAVVTSLLKVVLLGAIVALYWQPVEIATAVGVPPPEGGFQLTHVLVLRFLFSVMTYSWALSCASSWFFMILVLIALQTVCMAAAIADQRVLNDLLGDVVDAASEKQLFENSAVVIFGLLVATILFGERTNGKNAYRRRLLAFYAKHNPDKIADIGKILKKYEGKEELLFSRLHRKYSRVLSHTPAEDAVDNLDYDSVEDDAVAPEGAYIEEVEYIEATSSPQSSSTSSFSKTVTTTTSNSFDDKPQDDDEEDEANLPMIQPRVKSPTTKSPMGMAASVPPSSELSQSASGSAAGSAAGSRTSSPPRSPGSASANMVRRASEDARRALQERVQQRVAQLQSRSATKKKV